MKNSIRKFGNINIVMLLITICAVVISSFKMKETSLMQPENPELIRDRATAKKMYGDFLTKYPLTAFGERGGSISKATLEALLSKMTDDGDTKVYYIFGRTAETKNCIMLFNNPAFNDPTRTPSYMSAAPYCPDDCNASLMQYLTE